MREQKMRQMNEDLKNLRRRCQKTWLISTGIFIVLGLISAAYDFLFVPLLSTYFVLSAVLNFYYHAKEYFLFNDIVRKSLRSAPDGKKVASSPRMLQPFPLLFVAWKLRKKTPFSDLLAERLRAFLVHLMVLFGTVLVCALLLVFYAIQVN